jgi:hypothetical protein
MESSKQIVWMAQTDFFFRSGFPWSYMELEHAVPKTSLNFSCVHASICKYCNSRKKKNVVLFGILANTLLIRDLNWVIKNVLPTPTFYLISLPNLINQEGSRCAYLLA